MPLSQTLQTSANAIIDDVVTQLSTLQDTYKNDPGQGKYWQGITVTASTPADGANVATDLTKKPTDQETTWQGVGVTLAASIPVQVEVHTYDGPSGKGYVVCGMVIESLQ